MNYPLLDLVIGRQRCQHWIPLVTQQLRLRHLYQVIAFNLKSEDVGGFYFTLHQATLSAPFYTSEKINSFNPKWAELDLGPNSPVTITGVVLRIWQANKRADMDTIITTWGIHFSGLVYIGNRLPDISASHLKENTVILHLRGGFFTSHQAIRTDLVKPLPFIDYLNVISNESDTKPFKYTICEMPVSEIRTSYDATKLQRLHYLQIRIKNKGFDTDILRQKIELKCGFNENEIPNNSDESTDEDISIRYATQLLTMNSLNKMLQEKPTKFQKTEFLKLSKQIEIAKFRRNLLIKERNFRIQQLRHHKNKYAEFVEQNEERQSKIMEDYRNLSREIEKFKDSKGIQLQLKEDLQQLCAHLYHRRRQLMTELLDIYPIVKFESNKYAIMGVYLPNSEQLTEYTDPSISVALGYVAHVLIMCASFLQVPLRYSIVYMGSRSHIIDHIAPALADRDREFPLYTKGKDRIQFNYAVYLLNKNLAQLRLLCGQHTPDLRATLSNLLSFLQGRDIQDIGPSLVSKLEKLSLKLRQDEMQRNSKGLISIENGSCQSSSQPGINSRADNEQSSINVPEKSLDNPKLCIEPKHIPNRLKKHKEIDEGPGLSEILAIPEAYLNRQISANTFRNYLSASCWKGTASSDVSEESMKTDKKTKVSKSNQKPKPEAKPLEQDLSKLGIEEGTDPLNPDTNSKIDADKIEVFTEQKPVMRTSSQSVDITIRQKRKSRSVGSFEEDIQTLRNNIELGSDPVINISSEPAPQETTYELPSSIEDRQSEFLQKWLESSPALVCSEENLFPEEVLGTVSNVANFVENPLTVRTDALMNNSTSFNLVKPKF